MPYVAIHHSKALLNCIVRQPSNFIFIKGSVHKLHTKLATLYKHMTWNRAKYFEVFGLGCSGLGNFRFSSVVSGDFAIHFTYQVLFSSAILLSFDCGIHMTWKVICMDLSAYMLHGT